MPVLVIVMIDGLDGLYRYTVACMVNSSAVLWKGYYKTIPYLPGFYYCCMGWGWGIGVPVDFSVALCVGISVRSQHPVGGVGYIACTTLQ